MSLLIRTLVGSALLLATSLTAQAGEPAKKKPVKAAPLAASQTAKAPVVEPFNPFMIRVRAIAVLPGPVAFGRQRAPWTAGTHGFSRLARDLHTGLASRTVSVDNPVGGLRAPIATH